MALYEIAPRNPLQIWEPVNLNDPQFQGLGSFFKKAAKFVSKVVHAPIKLSAPSIGKKLEALDNKVINKIDDIHTDINKFFKRNWKWVIVAAALVFTIYTMGSGASIAAKLISGLVKMKALVVAKVVGWKSAVYSLGSQAAQKLLGGAKMGELSAQEVDALGNANAAAGTEVIPPEIMALMSKGAGASGLATSAEGGVLTSMPATLATVAALATVATAPASIEQAQAAPQFIRTLPVASPVQGGPGGPSKSLPPWAIPAAIGVGALALILIARR